ncbi:Wadjet anti-phage system protein JetD domain-containing protein [Paeniglutamicibacter sulfureus]|uniref:DUF3322 and DUF2220 domain-containing protein n=1 Tax=Paeniglutamicibacter sulfureus TaxID=43666 RepID=A0ABU2BIJ4_9MICC|nr:Wadjet anti-phage system protein JetD domain-containing protein [Paeniglutamicibacter sulfureus]MDR7358116.1 hypothetical protein [Paeniglutamicibacter sulfureus]
MSPGPVTPDAARAAARTKYDRHAGTWAAALSLDTPLLSIPLHSPTERAALADQGAAIGWVRSWSAFAVAPYAVAWGERRWANLGTQRVPERLVLDSPSLVAHVAGRAAHWTRLTERFARLLAAVPGDTSALSAALPRVAKDVVALDEPDFTRLLGVLDWLAGHPASGMFIRQLPIRGVDSKWVGSHRTLVQRLHLAASGHPDLGLAAKPDLVRMRFLDPALAPGGLSDVSAPLAELAALDISPGTVFVLENLETVLAMPPFPGAVVVHGSGYAVERLGRMPWARTAQVIYWGDLDSHGFAILNRLRSHGVTARSVLMDIQTLDAYADLCVMEPVPSTARLVYLTAAELETLQVLAERGNTRLEQERIPWERAVATLSRAAGSAERTVAGPGNTPETQLLE